MATRKTEATELAVGLGIVGINPRDLGADIGNLFRGSLSSDKWREFQVEYVSNERLYRRFFELGIHLREDSLKGVEQLVWTGPEQQAATASGAKDLFIPSINLAISVKNESNVVLNASPHNLFRSLPQGRAFASRAEHWFLEKDASTYQQMYAIARELFPGGLPVDARGFEDEVTRSERDAFQSFVTRGMPRAAREEFTTLYVRMCRNVAEESANEFNVHLRTLPANERSAVYENLMRQFFRLDTVPYLLVGLDRGKEFAVQIPDLTSWKRQWRVESTEARPDLRRSQSVVGITITTTDKQSRHVIYHFDFRVEIRWSHGKFCGNPEGKLYKNFAWSEVPFFVNLI